MKKTFLFNDRIIINDSLKGLKDIFINSKTNKYCLYFELSDLKKSLRKIKKLILLLRDEIYFDNIYFYNLSDFVNFVLNKPFYLPKNINLFINQSCYIGCNFCDKEGKKIFDKKFLTLSQIENFLSKYSLGDNMNINIIGSGDPAFNPELISILKYVKSLGLHITFFSGGKALLFLKDIDLVDKFIDEFKINISASNFEVYNNMHKSKITESEFNKLKNILKKIGYKTTFLTVIMKENILDLINYYKMVISLGGYGIEIKKNLQYNKNDILNNNVIFIKIKYFIKKIIDQGIINISSNVSLGLNKYVNLSNFHFKNTNILDIIIENYSFNLDIDQINKLGKCFQFGNSIDIIEDGKISICCDHDVGTVSELSYDDHYSSNELFIYRHNKYSNLTPDSCNKCPMPIDRYKNYLKYNFVKKL